MVAAVAIIAALVSLALAPAVVNGDGLGYLNAAVHGDLYPGHLAYVPLLGGLRALLHAGSRAVDALWIARGLSAFSGGLAVYALGRAAGRLLPDRPHAPLVAALGLACSFGTIGCASDVETYAPALAALCLAVWALAAQRPIAAGVAIAAATLFHVENVLFGLVALAALPRRQWPAVIASAIVSTGAVYLAAGASPAWLLGASHGFRYPLHWYTPVVALYGACKALLFSPYPYEASWALVIGHFVPGAIALGLLSFFAADGTPPLGRRATLAWAIPYGLVGVAFFASDAERWIFLLPLFWLAVASADRHARSAIAVAAALGALNLAVWLPHARDAAWRDRARAVAGHVRDGDLVISPGHGWDEYLGFYDGPPVGHYPLVFHAGRLGSADAVRQDLAEAVRDARRRGHQIILVRFDDTTDPMGWKELRPFGVTPANARTLLPPGHPVALGDAVYRLDP
jgi:hypothetical protein